MHKKQLNIGAAILCEEMLKIVQTLSSVCNAYIYKNSSRPFCIGIFSVKARNDKKKGKSLCYKCNIVTCIDQHWDELYN